MDFKPAFPTGQDSATFWDKGTEVRSLSRDKGTTGQAQNLTKGQDGSGQPVKIQDMTREWTVHHFDSLSRPIPGDKTGQSRKVHSKTGKGRINSGKGHTKTEKDVLNQEKMFLNRKMKF